MSAMRLLQHGGRIRPSKKDDHSRECEARSGRNRLKLLSFFHKSLMQERHLPMHEQENVVDYTCTFTGFGSIGVEFPCEDVLEENIFVIPRRRNYARGEKRMTDAKNCPRQSKAMGIDDRAGCSET